jgi:ribulose-phosphate 3-epimerase
MKKKVLIAPSLLSADFGSLADEIRDIEKSGADILHLDVMDGNFVPNISFGPVVIRSVRRCTALPFDVHLMIADPIKYIDDFRKAGADWITVHYEACANVDEVIALIKRSGAKIGISIKPKTALSDPRFLDVLKKVDLVLIMSVEPGFGGQSFMPEVLPKVKELRSLFNGLISIDGGINKETAPGAISAGVDILVAGSSVFGQKDRAEAIRALRN